MRNSIQDIAKILTDRHGLEQNEAEKFVMQMFDTIREGVEQESLVKVRGFGTFKIVGVEARESVNVNTGERVTIESHGKVTFTPDSTMKELVNKPFSQFETVILNEGIEFDDIDDKKEDGQSGQETVVEEVKEDCVAETEELVGNDDENLPVNEPLTTEEAPLVEVEPVVESSAVIEEDTENTTAGELPAAIEEIAPEAEEPETQQGQEPETMDNEPETAGDEPPSEESVEEDSVTDDVTERSNGAWKWGLFSVISLVLMAVSGYGGYMYGVYTATEGNVAKIETAAVQKRKQVVIRKIVRLKKDAVKSDSATAAQEKNSVTVDRGVEKKEEFDSSKYERMDNRVRTGAYRIVGTDKIVTARAGETLEDISRHLLGEGMSCYIEVYNGFERDVKLKAGQKILIPKLEVKKRARK